MSGTSQGPLGFEAIIPNDLEDGIRLGAGSGRDDILGQGSSQSRQGGPRGNLSVGSGAENPKWAQMSSPWTLQAGYSWLVLQLGRARVKQDLGPLVWLLY